MKTGVETGEPADTKTTKTDRGLLEPHPELGIVTERSDLTDGPH